MKTEDNRNKSAQPSNPDQDRQREQERKQKDQGSKRPDGDPELGNEGNTDRTREAKDTSDTDGNR